MSSCTINNTWIGEEYSPLLIEKIDVMLKREEASLNCHDYLNSTSYSHHPDRIDMLWRQKIAEWMFKVIDFYDLERDIVNVAMTYLDRMLSLSIHRLGRNQCCLLAMACLKLAIKLLEPRTLNMVDMIKIGLTSRAFSREQMVHMENTILFTLNWDVLPATTIEFAHYMICLLPSDVPKSTKYVTQELSKYMSELAICVYKLIELKPSVKALAIVSVAIENLNASIAVSTESQCIFAMRIFDTFEMRPDDDEISMLKEELNHLLHHNTNVTEFVKLILSSHKEEEYTVSESPKSVAANAHASTSI